MDSRDRAALTRTLQAIYREMGRAADVAIRRFAPGGRVPARSGGTGTTQGAEPPLGNPASDGYVLSSTTAGVRSWVAQTGAATTRWEPLTNGDVTAPELVFADGDVVMVEVPL